MLHRKLENKVKETLTHSDKTLVLSGARQIGRSFLINQVGRQLFKNFIEIDLVRDAAGKRLFSEAKTTADFHLILTAVSNTPLGDKDDTLIFFKGIEQYPQLLELLKPLNEEGRFRYAASGTLFENKLKESALTLSDSIEVVKMYPLDFEEFLIVKNVDKSIIEYLHECLIKEQSPIESVHKRLLDLFKKYLLVGGMPSAVNEFIESKNVSKIRDIQNLILKAYKVEAGRYDKVNHLKTKRIFEMIPSNMKHKKKRLFFNEIDGKKARASAYTKETDYLIDSGIAIAVNSSAEPTFPLTQTDRRRLLKLFLNDVGLLTSLLYGHEITGILCDEKSVSLGALYESAVAAELASLGHDLFYYDNRNKGEADFLINDYENHSVIPIQVKSGKNYSVYSALNYLLEGSANPLKTGIVLSNSGTIKREGKILYLPIYMVMLLK